MKRLSLLLKYSIFLISIIYIVLFICFYKKESKFSINDNKVCGYVRKIDNNKILIKSKEKIIVKYKEEINLEYNDYICSYGYIEVPSNNSLFNTFNYKEYLKHNYINYLFNSNKIEIIKKNNNILYTFKNYLYKRINKLSYSRDYIKLLIFNDKNEIDEEVYDSLKRLNILHLFTISSMHISILVGLINKIKRNKYKNIIIYIFLIILLFLNNIGVSILRLLIYYLLKNKLDLDNKKLLLLSGLIILLINPFYIFNIGFQFSMIVTFGILYFKDYYIYNKYINTLLITIVSFLSSLPIIINTNYEVNLLSILVNYIFSFFVSSIMFIFSLLVIIFPFVDIVLGGIIFFFEKIILFINNFNIVLYFSKISIVLIIIYYLLLFNKKSISKIILLILMVFLYFNNYYVSPRVYYLDVKQGDSILIRNKNKNILIDTGGYIDTIPFFKSNGLKKIDYLILTHGDTDHMGKAKDIIYNFKVNNVIFNCGDYNDLEKELIYILNNKNIKYYSCINKLDNLYFLQTKEYTNENDNSNVIFTEINGYKFLFMGDAGVEKERDILDKFNLSNIDVLKVGHHGSKTSSSEAFISEINPKYSIISVGKNNRYGHPNKEVIDNLKESKIYRTDQDGSIMFKINNELIIKKCIPK